MQTTISEWKKILKEHSKSVVEKRLEITLEEIKFLESIYMTGGENSHFSENFRDAAYKECQALCQLSSACYSILRDDYKIPSLQK